jgi:hypothetical protein
MSESIRLPEPPAAMKVVDLDESIWQAWQLKNAERDRRGATARMVALKCASLAVLVITAVLWGNIGAYHVAIRLALAVGAFAVAGQALRSRRYGFALTFFAIIVIYNPIFAIFPMTGGWPFLLVFLTALAFTVSLRWLRDEPDAGRSQSSEVPLGKTGVSAWENEGGASGGLEPDLVAEERKGAEQ